MAKDIKILCTLGPSSLKGEIIRQMDEAGTDLFRINLSHTKLEDIEKTIIHIKQHTAKPICLDTEGAQVRTGYLQDGNVFLKEGSAIRLTEKAILGNSSELCLRPEIVLEQLRIGDRMDIELGSVSLEVTEVKKDVVYARVSSEGTIGSNKAVHVYRKLHLPALSEKDKYAIQLALDYKLDSIALSFANSRADVEELRSYVRDNVRVISKLESRSGVANHSEIASLSDALLIDRGDLGSEEPVEKIPFIQKELIKEANARQLPIYVATNLLESMVTKRKPTRAEVSDVVNTLLDGADGLVLAAETAIGSYPVDCVKMIKRLIDQYNRTAVERV